MEEYDDGDKTSQQTTTTTSSDNQPEDNEDLMGNDDIVLENDDVPTIEETITKRGKPVLIVNDYHYTRHSVRLNGDILWACRDKKRHSCHRTLLTSGDGRTFRRTDQLLTHQHPPTKFALVEPVGQQSVANKSKALKRRRSAKKKQAAPDMDKMNVQQQIDKIVQKLSEDHPVALAMRNQRTVQLAQQYNQVKVEGRDPVVVDLGLMDEVNKVLKMSTSNRGKPLIIFNDFMFLKSKTKQDGKQVWECNKKRNLRCSARLVTVGDNQKVVRVNLEHNHDANSLEVEKRLAREKMKQDVAEGKTVLETLKTRLGEIPKEAPLSQMIGDRTSIERSLRYYRAKINTSPRKTDAKSSAINIDSDEPISERVTSKGHPILVVKGFEFLQSMRKTKKIMWVCREKKKINCLAHLTTKLDGKTLVTMVGQHNHESIEPSKRDEAVSLRGEARRRVTSGGQHVSQVVEQIYAAAGGEKSEIGKLIGPRAYFARMLRNCQRKAGIEVSVDEEVPDQNEDNVQPHEIRSGLTNKGRPLLVVRDQHYIQQESTDTHIHWCCRFRKRFKCYKAINTQVDGRTIIGKVPCHEHPCSPVGETELEVCERRQHIKSLVSRGMSIREAYQLVIDDFPESDPVRKGLGTFHAIDRWIRYQQHKAEGKLRKVTKNKNMVNMGTQTEMDEEEDEDEGVESMPILTTTRRNRPMLVLGGRQYLRRKELKSGDIRWVCCHQKRFNCNKSVVTTADGQLRGKRPRHNHQPMSDEQIAVIPQQHLNSATTMMMSNTMAATSHDHHHYHQILPDDYESVVVGGVHPNHDGSVATTSTAMYTWAPAAGDATALLSGMTAQADYTGMVSAAPPPSAPTTTYWNGFSGAQVITTATVPAASEHLGQGTQSIIY